MQDPNEYANQMGNTLSEEDIRDCRFVNITLGFHDTASGTMIYIVDEDPHITYVDLWEFCYCFASRLIHLMWTIALSIDKGKVYEQVKYALQAGVDELDNWLSTKKASELEHCDRSKKMSSRLYFVFCEHKEFEKLLEDVIVIGVYVLYKKDDYTKMGSGIKFIQNVMLVDDKNLSKFLVSMFAMFWRYLVSPEGRNTVGEYLDTYKQEMLDSYEMSQKILIEVQKNLPEFKEDEL